MAKKKNVQKAPVPAAVNKISNTAQPKRVAPVASKKESPVGFLARYKDVWAALCIAIIIFIALKVCLENQFTNWDDPGYVKDNALVKDVSPSGLQDILKTSVMGNYHPLTMLSYGIEYSYVRLEPYLYHLDSLLIHILTTLMFFWFVRVLTRNLYTATVTALLFGLHPMHMESVAWIAARKDVLYGFFYAFSCTLYVYYTREERTKKWAFYGASIIMFLASLLSKPVAVTLPISLLLVDLYQNRPLMPGKKDGRFKPMVYLEKIPFLLVSLGFGYRSLLDQREFKALNTLDVHFNFMERIALGAYAFVTYLWKAIVPIGLSNFYPYPEKVGDSLPVVYYLYVLALAALVFAVWFWGRKNKMIMFGCLFFLVNIVLLLQFIPVGGAILADRYSYVPYMGLFFIGGSFFAEVFEQNLWGMKNIALGVAVAYLGVLGVLAGQRCTVWYDTVSLWKDEVVKHPDVPSAFNNLGFEYFNRGYVEPDLKKRAIYMDSAEMNLKEAVRLQPSFVNPYVSLGEVARSRNDFPTAKMYYYKALQLAKSDEAHNAYLGLAIIYSISGQEASVHGINATPYFDSAQYCFRSAIRVKPYFPEAHSNYGNFFDMMHNFDSSYREYSLSISQNPDMYASYLNRARLLQRHNRCDDAFKDFDNAIQASPEIGEIYYSRAYCWMQKGDKKRALEDVKHAQTLGFVQMDPAFVRALQIP